MMIQTRDYNDQTVLLNKARINYAEYNGRSSSIVHFDNSNVVVKMSIEDLAKILKSSRNIQA